MLYNIKLHIAGQDLNFDLIQSKLPFKKVYICKKGDIVESYGSKDNIKEDSWQAVVDSNNIDKFHSRMHIFIEVLQNNLPFIKELKKTMM